MAAATPVFTLKLPDAAQPGHYRLLGMHGQEALGRLFEYRLRFCSDKPAIEARKLLGQTLALSMETASGKRWFHGYATGFEYMGPIELPPAQHMDKLPLYEYAVVLRPWLWFLTRSADCRVFQNLKVPQIVATILDKYPGRFEQDLADEDYRPWEYCVQYRETDFNFVSRLLEQEGAFYFFAHEEGSHTLKLVDQHGPKSKTRHKLVYASGERAARLETELVRHWRVAHEVQPGAYAIKDFDFKKPTAPQLSVVKQPYEHDFGKLEVFDYPGEFDAPAEGDGYVRLRLDELRAQHELMRAECNVRALRVGDVFELANAEQAGAAAGLRYMVSEASFDIVAGIEHEGQGAGYRCSFACVRADAPWRPQRLTRKPIVQGPQTATVVGPDGEEIHTDEYGRIKLLFHWDRHSKDDKASSCWIRVSQPWAGKNFGMVAIPRIGQEVVVDFLEGDPDRPLVTGRVYNQDNMPPFTLPANKTQTGILSRSSKGGSAANANALRFEDKKGAEQVWLHAEKNQDIEVENDETHWVGHDRTKTIDNDETTHVKRDRKETVGRDETITVHGKRTEVVDKDETITVHGKRTEVVDQDERITIHGNRNEKVDKNEALVVEGNRERTVKGHEAVTVVLTKTESIGLLYGLTVGAAMNQMVVGALVQEVGAAKSVNVVGVSSEEVGFHKSVKAGKAISHEAGTDIKDKATGNLSAEAGGTMSLQSGKDCSVQSKAKVGIVAADEISLKCGSAELVLKSNGDISIKGAGISITASGKLVLDASGALKATGSPIDMNG